MDQTILLVAAGGIAAGFVQGFSGFAFGLIAMAFWAWGLTPQIAGPLVVSASLLGQLLTIGSVRKAFSLGRVLPFIAGGIAGVPVGVAVLKSIDLTAFRLVVGLVLVLFPSAMLAAGRLPRIAAGGRLADGAIGFLGGVMGGIAGLSGAAPTLWTTLRGWKKDAQRAVIQSFNLAMHAVTLAVYALTGVLTRETVWLFLLLSPAVVVTALLGVRLYKKASEATFRRIVLALLALSGMALLAGALRDLAAGG
jgi:uncharacterized membrane protein YfcA